MSRNPAHDTTLRDLLFVGFRHKKKSLGAFFTIALGTIAFLILAPRTYRSEGKVFLRLGRENATLDPTATFSTNPVVAVPQSREDELNSAVAILGSRALAEQVVTELTPEVVLGKAPVPGAPKLVPPHPLVSSLKNGVDRAVKFGKDTLTLIGLREKLDDQERAIIGFAETASITRGKDSNVIDVTFDSPDPYLSQAVVARLIDRFREEHIQLNRPLGAHDFLADQKTRLEGSLAAAETTYRDLKNETGLIAPAEQRQTLVTQIGELENAHRDAQASLAAVESEIRVLNEKLNELPAEQVTSRISGVTNEGTDGIRQQIFTLRLREQQLAAAATDDHPQLKNVREQLAAAERVLEAQEATRTHVTTAPDRGHEETHLALLRQLPLQASYQAKATTLAAQLADAKESLNLLNENEMRVTRAQRDMDLFDVDYRKYTSALEQARIDDALGSEKISNVRVVQAASFQALPVRPRKALVGLGGLALAIAAAFGLAFGAEFLDHSFRTPEEVERRLELPVLASIPLLPPVRHEHLERM